MDLSNPAACFYKWAVPFEPVDPCPSNSYMVQTETLTQPIHN
ncbi:hypothetical protein Huta_2031 [Halorhabdus utahensis DSM 12940]|uniref:Uncharacterized protein n=1 Tax=Halorhabdus utahensis (strain DSM 12940 / JCM 11049 / AX-2) TaxID=519442 RepID=C7NTK9_HALUD|nr:hypothetical protein Huta_2031 [Halorhabdus utahensis DSM 12940]